jgi:hypothetical protein
LAIHARATHNISRGADGFWERLSQLKPKETSSKEVEKPKCEFNYGYINGAVSNLPLLRQ